MAILEVTETQRLARRVAAVAATDGVEPGTEVVITRLDDHPDRTKRWTRSSYVDDTGTWRGATTRDGVLRLGGHVEKDVLERIRGAPVRRRDDDVVIGIVSTPCTDHEDSVLVARTEDLRAFSDGVIRRALNIVPLSRRDVPSISIALNIVAATLVIPFFGYLETERGRSVRGFGAAMVAIFALFCGLIAHLQLRRCLPHFTRKSLFRRLQPFVFALAPAILVLVALWIGAQIAVSIAPRPVVLYLLDQTAGAQRIEGDLDRVLMDQLGSADTEAKAALWLFGGGPRQASPCQAAAPPGVYLPYDGFKRELPKILSDSTPSGNASLQDAVVGALADVKRQPGKKTLVVITTGGDDECDPARPDSDLASKRDPNVQIVIVDVRLEPVEANDNRRSFPGFLASALDADYKVGSDIASLRDAVAPPTYRNPGLR